MLSEPKSFAANKFDAFRASVNTNSPIARKNDPSSHSVIGKELIIKGNIMSSGSIELDGRVEGDVDCQAVIVGKEGQVQGKVNAEEVVVDGHVKGDVRGLHVTLKSNAHVDGDIFHSTFAVEQGAIFVGSSRSCDNPAEASSKPVPVGSTDNDNAAKNGRANGRTANGSLNGAALVLSADDIIVGPR